MSATVPMPATAATWRPRRAECIDEAPTEVVVEVVRRLGLLLGGDAA